MDEHYNIGQLARAAGVPLSTLRYYERAGLLYPTGRARNNYQRAGKKLKPWWVSSVKIRHSCNLQRSFAKEGSYASPLARRHSVHAFGVGSGRQRLCCLWRGSTHLRSPSAPHFYAARTCGGGVQMSPLL